MNTREQYLQKQNERLANQNAVLLRAFENLMTENEVLGSIACAFAWDLVASANYSRMGCDVVDLAISDWDEAVKAVGG